MKNARLLEAQIDTVECAIETRMPCPWCPTVVAVVVVSETVGPLVIRHRVNLVAVVHLIIR